MAVNYKRRFLSVTEAPVNMAPKQGSPALRRRLRVELRRARTRASLTQKDVAQALDWSPSKVIRIESGQVAISTTDLKALLAEYRVRDDAVIADLVDLARNSKKQPWSQYKDVLSPDDQAYFGYESAASIVRQFEPLLVPGLLQTEEYTRALLADAFDYPQRQLDRLVEARKERQELLIRDDAPEVFCIVDEAVTRRQVGGAEVMRNQLQRLLSLAELPLVTLQVMPFDAGAYQGLQGPFVLLEFSEQVESEPVDEESEDTIEVEADNFVLYLESRESLAVRDQPEIMGEYLERFLDLEKAAASPERTLELLKEAIEQH
jgi:transcriptional regulator with XRE-family HTH domain